MRTGLVMEGGALRTIYSTGVCDAMLESGILPDYFIGVSAGAAYGVSYLSRQPRRNLEILMRFARDRRYMGMNNLADPKNRCYFGLRFTYDEIPRDLVPFDFAAFARWPGQAEAVVTDLETGRADYLEIPREDEQFLALQASCALPLLFPTYEIGGRTYLDGGVADAIPWRRALDMGCDRVMVILTKPRDYRRGGERLMPLIRRQYKQWPNFIRAMEARAQVYNDCRDELFRLEREGKVLVIAPRSTLGVGRIERDTKKLQLLWAEGYQMAVERMDEIRQWLDRGEETR